MAAFLTFPSPVPRTVGSDELRTVPRAVALDLYARAAEGSVLSTLSGWRPRSPSTGQRRAGDTVDDAIVEILTRPWTVMRVSIRTSGLHAQGWWSLREADALFSTVTLEGDLAVGTIVPFAALCDAIADDVGGDDGEASAVVEQTDASAMTALSLRPGLVRDEADCARLLGLDDVESQTRLRRLVEHGLVDATPEGVALGEASSSIWPSFLPASMDVVAYPCDLTVPGSRGVPVGIRFVGPREHRFHASRQGCPPGHVGLFRAPKAVTRVLAASIAGQPTGELITHLVGLDSTS